jgi:coenzyme A diphosphatase NUDT7
MKQPRSDSSDLLRYHRPKLRLEDAPIPRPSAVSKQSVPLRPPCSERAVIDTQDRCLQNLTSYRAPSTAFVFPRARCAAVLVALFVGRMGDLYVLLNRCVFLSCFGCTRTRTLSVFRRASTLRSYAGDTSLPGGKYEPDDRSLEETARREAFEEVCCPFVSSTASHGALQIGLSPDRDKVPLLCILEPFLVGNHLIVTPYVHPSVRDICLLTILQSCRSHPGQHPPRTSHLSSLTPLPH